MNADGYLCKDGKRSMARLVEFLALVQGMVVTNFGLFYLGLSFFAKGYHVIDGMVIVSSGLGILFAALGLKGYQSKLEGKPAPGAGGGGQ